MSLLCVPADSPVGRDNINMHERKEGMDGGREGGMEGGRDGREGWKREEGEEKQRCLLTLSGCMLL